MKIQLVRYYCAREHYATRVDGVVIIAAEGEEADDLGADGALWWGCALRGEVAITKDAFFALCRGLYEAFFGFGQVVW